MFFELYMIIIFFRQLIQLILKLTTLEDDTTYTVAICGVAEEVQKEGNIQDSGILGLDAAREYFSQFESLSKKDIAWK